jgi:7-cyano-7-deazaguanine reductase
MAGENNERDGRLKRMGNVALHSKEPLYSTIQTFQNKFSSRRYWVRLECPEFAFVSRFTGEQESAKLTIEYVPEKRCVERGSLELYLASYRGSERSNEEMLNLILEHFVSASRPSEAVIHGEFSGRGGTRIFDARFPTAPAPTRREHQMLPSHQGAGQHRRKKR